MQACSGLLSLPSFSETAVTSSGSRDFKRTASSYLILVILGGNRLFKASHELLEFLFARVQLFLQQLLLAQQLFHALLQQPMLLLAELVLGLHSLQLAQHLGHCVFKVLWRVGSKTAPRTTGPLPYSLP